MRERSKVPRSSGRMSVMDRGVPRSPRYGSSIACQPSPVASGICWWPAWSIVGTLTCVPWAVVNARLRVRSGSNWQCPFGLQVDGVHEDDARGARHVGLAQEIRDPAQRLAPDPAVDGLAGGVGVADVVDEPNARPEGPADPREVGRLDRVAALREGHVRGPQGQLVRLALLLVVLPRRVARAEQRRRAPRARSRAGSSPGRAGPRPSGSPSRHGRRPAPSRAPWRC